MERYLLKTVDYYSAWFSARNGKKLLLAKKDNIGKGIPRAAGRRKFELCIALSNKEL